MRFSGTLIKNLAKIKPKAYAAAKMFAQQGAFEMQNYARVNRPWKDRTARAKQSIMAVVEEEPNALVIKLSIGVDYGIYLELAHGKKYAIIAPTIRIKGKEIFNSFKNFLNKIM